MKGLIIYDSFFGNTEKVAEAMASGLANLDEVTTHRVSDVQPEELANADWLIVGSPTRAFRPTPAIKSLIESLPAKELEGVKVAAFDTRISVEDTGSWLLSLMVNLFGYAAKPIANLLKKKAGKLVLPPEGFIVQDTEGPLREGELKRAEEWAMQMAIA